MAKTQSTTDLQRTLAALKNVNVSSLNQSIVVAAAIFVIIIGIRYTASITTPLLFGLFLAILMRPVHQLLLNKGISNSVALIITVIGLSAILFILGVFMLGAFRSIQSSLTSYRSELTTELEQVFPSNPNLTQLLPHPEQISTDLVSVAGQVIATAASTISTLIISVIVASMLVIEAPRLKKTLTVSIGDQPSIANNLTNFSNSAIIYFLSRTKLNALTGIGLACLYVILGVENPLVWGFMAFILSYIPYIGLFLALTPPTIFTFAQSGPTAALILVGAGIIWNLAIENILQPAYVGKTLKLSPTLVFIAFFFFGWLLGPLGALLSMPLTVMLVMLLQSYPETKWLANLMSPLPESEVVSPSQTTKKAKKAAKV